MDLLPCFCFLRGGASAAGWADSSFATIWPEQPRFPWPPDPRPDQTPSCRYLSSGLARATSKSGVSRSVSQRSMACGREIVDQAIEGAHPVGSASPPAHKACAGRRFGPLWPRSPGLIGKSAGRWRIFVPGAGTFLAGGHHGGIGRGRGRSAQPGAGKAPLAGQSLDGSGLS